ncbi:MAG: hypothetical protein II745_07770 [Lachnospiraceae bacterium]|nr:hypothetical protein [Lachnospiraceae bacterium]
MSIFNDIGDGFKEAGKFMVDKTNELSGKAKNSIEKNDVNNEILNLFQELGKELYNCGGDSSKIPDLNKKLEVIGQKVTRLNELSNTQNA